MKLKDLIPTTENVTQDQIDAIKTFLIGCWDKCDELCDRKATPEEWKVEYEDVYEDFDEMFFMGSKWEKSEAPADPKDKTYSKNRNGWYKWTGQHLCVMCSDTFYYACADAEHVPDSELIQLLKGIDQFGYQGIIAYVSRKRGDEIPQITKYANLNPLAVKFFKNIPKAEGYL